MSSLKNVINNRFKIALFVGGLGCDGSFFNSTINKLNTYSKTYRYDKTIDMSDYLTLSSQFIGAYSGSLMPSNNALQQFNLNIAEIVSLSKNNANKTIMVKTKLDKRPVSVKNGSIEYKKYDSIDEQSKKLVKIINSIKSLDSSIKIILVGHSQGGLVNLKTATEIPGKIDEMISISTPYSPVTTAYLLRGVSFIATIFKQNVYQYFSSGDYDEYEKRVKTLSDLNFFKELKKKWNSLSSRPKLTVIAGISAHIMTSIYRVICFIPFETNFRYAFDGLVMGREQVNIDHADIYVLHNPGVECYEKSDGFQHSCCSQFGLINNHVCNCALPCLDISRAAVDSALNALSAAIDKGSVNLDDIPVAKALIEGIDGVPCSDENYRQYYEIIGGNYSHKNIVVQNDTIGLILGIFSK